MGVISLRNFYAINYTKNEIHSTQTFIKSKISKKRINMSQSLNSEILLIKSWFPYALPIRLGIHAYQESETTDCSDYEA